MSDPQLFLGFESGFIYSSIYTTPWNPGNNLVFIRPDILFIRFKLFLCAEYCMYGYYMFRLELSYTFKLTTTRKLSVLKDEKCVLQLTYHFAFSFWKVHSHISIISSHSRIRNQRCKRNIDRSPIPKSVILWLKGRTSETEQSRPDDGRRESRYNIIKSFHRDWSNRLKRVEFSYFEHLDLYNDLHVTRKSGLKCVYPAILIEQVYLI